MVRIFFHLYSLAKLGLRIQLGHDGGPCGACEPASQSFIVVDVNFVQTVNVDFCRCIGWKSHREQLLKVEWYPATVKRPKTCFTVCVLELFHTLSFMGKISAYEFYKSLEHLTDNTETCLPKV